VTVLGATAEAWELSPRIKAVLIALVVLFAGLLSYIVFFSASPNSHAASPTSGSCLTSAKSPPIPYATGNLTAGNWTTYHGDNSRSGAEAMANITAVHPEWSGAVRLDGDVYAEPLVCGNAVLVATENDSVYALNATTGSILWRTHLGTPVPGSTLPCGDIDPSGITGTPVIDAGTRTIYVVAFLNTTQHVLFGLDIDTGSVLSHVVADATGLDPQVEQQRGALALSNGVVYIPYGGLAGDCGSYHGWIVGVRTDGSGGLLSYQVPTGRAGGIWAPAGITVAPNGNLYVATGNSDATTTFDYGDSVIELSPSLQELGHFAPANWAQLNSHDTDLGSVAPTILPNGDVFQIGKEGVGYILSGTNLGGIGGQVYNASLCAGAYGGTARVGQSVLIPCTDGIVDANVGASTISVTWQTSSFDAGSPIVTGNIVWAVNISTADLLGFDLSTGAAVFSFSLGAVDHFISPTAAAGSLFVAGGDQLYAFALAS
jgi:outer membrane protein assembly factor BamB